MESKGTPFGSSQHPMTQNTPINERQVESLPHNFAFHYTEMPKTPEPLEPVPQPIQPGPPKVRIRRRRPAILSFDGANDDDEPWSSDVVPTIEVSHAEGPVSMPQPTRASDIRASNRLCTPTAVSRISSSPKTPLHQIHTPLSNGFDKHNVWSPTTPSTAGATIKRPSSGFSDSSISSSSSFDTDYEAAYEAHYASVSCTSPESDANDPFVTSTLTGKQALGASAQFHLKDKSNPKKHRSKVQWTADMDNHLMLTYAAYLSDPVVTPFKTLPGTAPPLGVCHRVAREAKRSWKGHRVTLNTVPEDDGNSYASLDATIMRDESSAPPKFAVPIQSESTSSNGPGDVRRLMSPWPRSGCSTRKRLRQLCKQKPALSPHYQRIIQSRSPSPFESNISRVRFSSPSSAFSTRDMNFTLATSTAKTMQPGNPLAMLHYDGDNRDHRSIHHNPPSRSRSPCSTPHHKSHSLHSARDLSNHRQPLKMARYLRSPFQEQPGHEVAPPMPPPLHSFDGISSGVQQQLQSPLELHHPRPMSNSMKRRAEAPLGDERSSEDPEIRRDWLNTFFDDKDSSLGKRRLRRGFSLGTGLGNPGFQSRHISELFTPPDSTSAAGQESSSASSHVADHMQSHSGNVIQQVPVDPARLSILPPGQHQLPQALANGAGVGGFRPARHLGSPFAPNTFPRS